MYHNEELYHYVDGYDMDKSNWMRHVNPANSLRQQNLVACQVKLAIFFYTVKAVAPNTELLVWYCREFAIRLNYPLTTNDRQLGKVHSVPGDKLVVKGEQKSYLAIQPCRTIATIIIGIIMCSFQTHMYHKYII